MSDQVATFEDLLSATKDPDVVVIDVREPHELEETGKIPSSINIPLGQVEDALSPQLAPVEFKTKFGLEKPGLETPIIFSCRLGGRGAKAQQTATNLGYKNTKNFMGGWEKWEKEIKTQQ